MNIPMVDLRLQYETLRDEIDKGFHSVLESAQFILGPNVSAFEQEVAQYCGVRNAISVASGTDALHLSLRAAGIGQGDEVITTAFTFIGTAEAISYTGAEPVFVDIDPDTFSIDVVQIEKAIKPKTRAVVVVHLFGQPVDLNPIVDLCQKHGLILIEDCAQSFGADYKDQKTGSFGRAGCFSFYPSKNLGAYGDGGMVITDDNALADAVRVLRNHGSKAPNQHKVIGYNSRLDELQAVVLRVKLKYIDTSNAARRNNAALYSESLKHPDIVTPFESQAGTHIYNLYTIRSDKRDQIRQALTNADIASAVFYPTPLHQQEAYTSGTSLPVSEQMATSVLSLPMYPELSMQQIDRVSQTILDAI